MARLPGAPRWDAAPGLQGFRLAGSHPGLPVVPGLSAHWWVWPRGSATAREARAQRTGKALEFRRAFLSKRRQIWNISQ